MTKSKNSDTTFMERLCQKFVDIADTIPAEQWGFNPEVFELLREKRHEIVNKFPAKIAKSLSKKDKVKMGREYGPKCNTVTEIIDWVSKTHLAKKGVPKTTPSLKKNGSVKEKNPEAIAKASKEKRQNQKVSRKKNNTKKQQKPKSKGKVQKKKETVKKVKKVKPAKKKNRGGAPATAASS